MPATSHLARNALPHRSYPTLAGTTTPSCQSSVQGRSSHGGRSGLPSAWRSGITATIVIQSADSTRRGRAGQGQDVEVAVWCVRHISTIFAACDVIFDHSALGLEAGHFSFVSLVPHVSRRRRRRSPAAPACPVTPRVLLLPLPLPLLLLLLAAGCCCCCCCRCCCRLLRPARPAPISLRSWLPTSAERRRRPQTAPAYHGPGAPVALTAGPLTVENGAWPGGMTAAGGPERNPAAGSLDHRVGSASMRTGRQAPPLYRSPARRAISRERAPRVFRSELISTGSPPPPPSPCGPRKNPPDPRASI